MWLRLSGLRYPPNVRLSISNSSGLREGFPRALGSSPGLCTRTPHRHRRRRARRPRRRRGARSRRDRLRGARAARGDRRHLGHRQPRQPDVRVGALHLVEDALRLRRLPDAASRFPTTRRGGRCSSTCASFARDRGLEDRSRSAPRSRPRRRRPTAAGTVRLADGGPGRSPTLVAATGPQWQPRMPDLPGEFTGEEIHSRELPLAPTCSAAAAC